MNMQVLTKVSEPTNPAWGSEPGKRGIEALLRCGLVVLDKPCGPSSHQASAWVRDMLALRKAGHGGTLDPNVSGVLPVALERATRAMGFLLGSRKEYVGIIRFHRDVGERDVREAFKRFEGTIAQVPPVKSAVARKLRHRKVYYLKIIEIKGREALFRTECEAGTYIRKLCHDIGVALGAGAHMLELRRTRSGVLSEAQAVTLQQLSDAYWLWKEKGEESALRSAVLPLESAIDIKKIWVKDSAVEALCSGADLAAPGISMLHEGIAEGERIAVMSLKGELVCIAIALADSKKMMESGKGVACDTLRVVMEKGTYPRLW